MSLSVSFFFSCFLFLFCFGVEGLFSLFVILYRGYICPKSTIAPHLSVLPLLSTSLVKEKENTNTPSRIQIPISQHAALLSSVHTLSQEMIPWSHTHTQTQTQAQVLTQESQLQLCLFRKMRGNTRMRTRGRKKSDAQAWIQN